MPRYAATYREPITGRTEVITREAFDWRAAHLELPRWSYPNGKPMRRQGAPRKVKDDKL